MDQRTADLLRLTLLPGLGPVRVAGLLEAFGDPGVALRAPEAALKRAPGIGPKTAQAVTQAKADLESRFEAELRLLHENDVRVLAIGGPGYPPLLAELPGAPPVLYVRGTLEGAGADRFPAAIVGSRACTAYGIEQAEHFGGVLARAGLTVVSGGARGIDTAAHRGALRAGGRTIAVLGCGLARCYPPENQELFDRIAAGSGALVSELPMATPPEAQNFPARNRLISGLSLGVIVIEASKGSGALITARHAAEDHGREVMALPGRVDSAASAGSLELLRRGGAHLVRSPGDAIEILEASGWHASQGTYALFAEPSTQMNVATNNLNTHASGDPIEAALLHALAQPRTVDELIRDLHLAAGEVAAAVTRLEIRGAIRRLGGRLHRA